MHGKGSELSIAMEKDTKQQPHFRPDAKTPKLSNAMEQGTKKTDTSF